MTRVLHLAAGAAGLHCGACARDATLARALLRRGHEVELQPLYTPLSVDGEVIATAPVLFGGINLWLQERVPLLRRLPSAWRRWLDSPRLLALASRFASASRPADLGRLTVAVLEGEEGPLAGETARLVSLLLDRPRPDLISLTNPLLSGIAPPLRRALGVPFLCALQGEEPFLDALGPPWTGRARELLRRNAESVDLFLAPCRAAADLAAWLPTGRTAIVPPGVETAAPRAAPRPRAPFVIGALGAISPAKGTDLLVEAFVRLVRERGVDARLVLAGLVHERRWWEEVARPLAAPDLAPRVSIPGVLDRAGKESFFRNLSVFAAPVRQTEVRALAALEALAAGLPLVAPDAGVFRELHAPGALLFRCGDGAALADALAGLAADPVRADALGDAGSRLAAGSNDRMAEAFLAAAESVLGRTRA